MLAVSIQKYTNVNPALALQNPKNGKNLHRAGGMIPIYLDVRIMLCDCLELLCAENMLMAARRCLMPSANAPR